MVAGQKFDMNIKVHFTYLQSCIVFSMVELEVSGRTHFVHYFFMIVYMLMEWKHKFNLCEDYWRDTGLKYKQ